MSTIAQDAAAPGADSRADPTDERPLTDDERKMVSRLLSDPFTFPQQYKTWLIAFLEGSDLTLPLSSILGLSSLLGTAGGGSPGIFKLLPAGMIFAWGGNAVPQGTFECNGQTLNRVTYDRLFKVTGTSWGAGDGLTTFNVPDLRKRGVYGAGTGKPVATTDGMAEGSRFGPDHHHYFTDSKGFGVSGGTDGVGDHGHGISVSQASYTQIREGTQGSLRDAATQLVSSLGTAGAGGHSHGFSGSGSVAVGGNTSGGGQQDVIANAYVMYIINA